MGVGRARQTEDSVPSIKYSLLPLQNFVMTERGFSGGFDGYFSRSMSVISLQMGVAPVMPEVSVGCMGVLSLFPTQTVTTKSFVYPMVQLSRFSLLVPVLTGTHWPGIKRSEREPNDADRAELSLRMSEIINVVPSGATRFSFIALLSSNTIPL